MDFTNFNNHFNQKVRSDRRTNILVGIGVVLFGLVMIVISIIKSEVAEVPYIFIAIIISFGVIILYRFKHGLRITSHPKHVTEIELENNLNTILKNENVDMLERNDNYFVLFIKPKGLSAWHEVHLLIDSSTFYINARQVWSTLVDFGTAKDLENKIVFRLNKSR
jgi:c-di-AMP phosphodiesterase-like protein